MPSLADVRRSWLLQSLGLSSSSLSTSDLDQLLYNRPAGPEVVAVPASGLLSVLGSPSLTQVSRVPVWLLDAAVIESIGGLIDPPYYWNTCHVDLVWINAGLGAGDVVFRFDISPIVDEEAIPDPLTGTSVFATANAQNIVKRTRVASSVPVASGQIVFEVVKFATHASDTLPNDVGVVSLVFTRES